MWSASSPSGQATRREALNTRPDPVICHDMIGPRSNPAMISQRPSYLDIELQVRPRSGSDYPVEAYCAPLGHAHGTMRLPFAEADLQGHLAGMAPVAKDREVGAAG